MTRKWRGDDFKSPERKRHCVEITGKVAEWVAEQLINDNKILAKDSK
jgi:putative oxidoreductase